MKDVIERMLKVEGEATAALAGAKKKAADLAESARREAAEKSDAIRKRMREETASRLEASRASIETKRRESLAAFDRDDAAWVEQVRPRTAEAAEAVVKKVLGA